MSRSSIISKIHSIQNEISDNNDEMWKIKNRIDELEDCYDGAQAQYSKLEEQFEHRRSHYGTMKSVSTTQCAQGVAEQLKDIVGSGNQAQVLQQVTYIKQHIKTKIDEQEDKYSTLSSRNAALRSRLSSLYSELNSLEDD